MPLSAGTRLGPYEILALIGVGGMGEVYRARDPRMGREVAIKVSAERFSDRFSREVHAVAALNHQNICHLYDVGPDYLVMELVEGQAPKGPLPLDEALRIAKQIADALEAAHEKGIVHRDLKPANIKIRPDGMVKVLDFGLAKLIRDGAGNSDGPVSEDSPTLSMTMTQAGVILGTAAYMPPEQARGKPVDKRADIWAFGVVLYEMLTGERLFGGVTVSDTLIDVATKEPEWERVPVKVRRLLRRCLEKDPKRRLRDIGEAWFVLEDVGQEKTLETAPSPSRFGKIAWGAAGVLAVALTVALWVLWRGPRPVEQPLMQLDIDLGPEISLRPPGSLASKSVIISPDGTRLAYIASVSGGQERIFTRRLDQPKATELPGTEGSRDLFFSPEGQWIGFYAHNKLSKVSVEGGAVVLLGDVSPGGATWGEDGNIIVAGGANKGLMLIPSSGGAFTPVTELTSGELGHENPQFLPGGKAVVFMVLRSFNSVDDAGIEVVSLADRRRKTLARGGAAPHYVVTSNGAGYLIYHNERTEFAIPFDLDRLETRGSAVPVLDGLDAPSVSQGGTLVYLKVGSGDESRMMAVQWLDAAGKTEPLLAKPGAYDLIHLSPDGKRLAVDVTDGLNHNIRVYDPERDATTPLTFGAGSYFVPIWSPDGKYVVFCSIGGILWTRADGASQPQALTQSQFPQIPGSFSPDGKWLAYYEFHGDSGVTPDQIWTVPVENSGGELRAVGKPDQFFKDQFNNRSPAFSPDGRWIAYASNESGTDEVYVRPFRPASGQNRKVPVSNSGGIRPVWSPNAELLYQFGGKIMAVHYTVKGGEMILEKPRMWASKLTGAKSFDLAPDGKRAAVVLPVETAEAPKAAHEVTFLFNFSSELRRLVPAGK